MGQSVSPDESVRLCECVRLCNELFRTIDCVKQPSSIYDGPTAYGGWEGAVTWDSAFARAL